MKYYIAIFAAGFFACSFSSVLAAPIVADSFSATWNTGSDSDIFINLGACPSSIYWEEIGNSANNGTTTSCDGGTFDQTVSFPSPGQYRTDFSGSFTSINLGDSTNKDKFRTVEQWGNSVWSTMANAFNDVNDLVFSAADVPDLSNVTSMAAMFYSADNFNSNINNWDVSNVTNMTSLFHDAPAFNQPLNNWDVSNVTTMQNMFTGPWFQSSAFNQPLNNWDTSNVTNMDFMFQWATSFNQDISAWDVSKVTSMIAMFDSVTVFNQPLNTWDTSNVTNMDSMFFSHNPSAFNQPLNNWDVSNVTNMHQLFSGASSFNQDISAWNVSAVTNMSYMFQRASSFNQPLNTWDVSQVTNFGQMFDRATAFNQPLNMWDTTAASNFSGMFSYATSFNQPIAIWDVSSVSNMSYMFYGASSFNQDISSWNVSNVTDFTEMFIDASAFDQSLGTWQIQDGDILTNIFRDSGLSPQNYATLLIDWSEMVPLASAIDLGIVSTTYCVVAEAARASLTATSSWTITDLGPDDCIPDSEEEATSTVSSDNGSSGTIVGLRKKRLDDLRNAMSSSTAPVSEKLVSFVSSLKKFLNYLTTHEEEVKNLSPEESKAVIMVLRDAILELLKWLPGV